MSKKILIVGASGLVGREILENLKTTNNDLILLSRKKLLCENGLKIIENGLKMSENDARP